MGKVSSFSTRFHLADEDPVALVQTLHKAPQEETASELAWAALSLLSQIVFEGEGADKETSPMLFPSETQRALLDPEDVEFCHSLVDSGSVEARELAVTRCWYFKEFAYWKGSAESLEGLASRVFRSLPIERCEEIKAGAEALAVDVWRQRIADLRQLSPHPEFASSTFLRLVRVLFQAAQAKESPSPWRRPGELIDPDVFVEQANLVGEALSTNAWHYARQAVSEQQSNLNTRDALISLLLIESRIEEDPVGSYQLMADIGHGLSPITVARFGKRAQEWMLPEDETSGTEHERLEFDLQDPSDVAACVLVSFLSLMFVGLIDVHEGAYVLSEPPHEPLEYCHVHAFAAATYLVAARWDGSGDGWPAEVVDAAWEALCCGIEEDSDMGAALTQIENDCTTVFINSAYSNPFWSDSIDAEDPQIIRNEMARRRRLVAINAKTVNEYMNLSPWWALCGLMAVSAVVSGVIGIATPGGEVTAPLLVGIWLVPATVIFLFILLVLANPKGDAQRVVAAGVVFPYEELTNRSYARFQAWLFALEADDPHLHASVVHWLHEEELRAERARQHQEDMKAKAELADAIAESHKRSATLQLQRSMEQSSKEAAARRSGKSVREGVESGLSGSDLSYQRQQQQTGQSQPTCIWSGCNQPGIAHTASGWFCGLHAHGLL